jgi:hypothetical protein
MPQQMMAVGRVYPSQGVNVATVLAEALMHARPKQPQAPRGVSPEADEDTPPIRGTPAMNRLAQIEVNAFRGGNLLMAQRLATARTEFHNLGLFSVNCPQCHDRLTVDLDNPDDKGHCTTCEGRGT